ncbi:receptor-transporting protein 3-like [Oenanthe melanoleuca]|uniref:receptor-transporting protein 3-like n=1 Tax=Oenanthe melanoleuca TaxID=2939378 RepID=UPI0024C17A82|nr:receptor-transporting protein 3-like [Oenanthe melanoleuca]
MITWQNIFAVKIEEMHITDPWTLLEDDGLQVQACRPGWKEFVQRRALGRFQCSQCFQKWSSAKVHILFHMCHCQGWGTVQMRIFRQKCRRCPNSRLEDPEFSLETIETILHNLVLKILQYFYKKPVQHCDLLEVVVDTPVTGPHDCARCEACQLGICSRPRSAPALDAWKPLADEGKARMNSTEPRPAWPSDVWKSLTNMGQAGLRRAESWWSLGSDDSKSLIGVDKARTHHTKLQPAPARVARNANVSRTTQTLKCQALRPQAGSTQQPSPSNRDFPWKRCCCIGSSLLCVLALIIFVVLYLTVM